MFLLTAYDVNTLTAGGHSSESVCLCVCVTLLSLLSVNSTDGSTEHTQTHTVKAVLNNKKPLR